MNKLSENCIFISALNKYNIEEFRKCVVEAVKAIHITSFPDTDFLYQAYSDYT